MKISELYKNILEKKMKLRTATFQAIPTTELREGKQLSTIYDANDTIKDKSVVNLKKLNL